MADLAWRYPEMKVICVNLQINPCFGAIHLPETTWNAGRVLGPNEVVNLATSILIAEVFSKAVRPDDGDLVGCFVLAHEMDAEVAESAMHFFHEQPALIVDAAMLAAASGAELPASVVIRWTDETQEWLATFADREILKAVPNGAIRECGWELFCAVEGLKRGAEIEHTAPLPEYDYRRLRRKIFALRAFNVEDRTPWLEEEYARLKELTRGQPEGCEAFIALAEDMRVALDGGVTVADGFSVVIPTKVERGRYDGALFVWERQTGREIVVAHGLDAAQAALTLSVVQADPEAFVSREALLSGAGERETLGAPFVVPDAGLSWITTDFSGRRNAQAYEALRARINSGLQVDLSQARPMQSIQR